MTAQTNLEWLRKKSFTVSIFSILQIILPIYTIWVENQKHTNDLLLIGILLVNFLHYIRNTAEISEH